MADEGRRKRREEDMIGIDGNLAGLTATTQVAKAVEAVNADQKQEEKRSTTADVLDAVTSGGDVLELGARGCIAAADALKPTHLTGGKEALAGFTTGGGDGVANTFQTVADCTSVAEAATGSAGFMADAAGMVGDVVSGAADVVGGVIGGVFDGL
jgi:hypothetical protein